jgi:hypothetical protein
VAIDVPREILTNRALSADYNVVGFRAPTSRGWRNLAIRDGEDLAG